MPYIRTANEHVPPIRWHTYAGAMASLHNELGVFVESLICTGNQLDCSVLNNRVDNRNVDDYEVTLKRAIDVVMLRMTSREIKVTANIWHSSNLRVQLLNQLDDPTVL